MKTIIKQANQIEVGDKIQVAPDQFKRVTAVDRGPFPDSVLLTWREAWTCVPKKAKIETLTK
jgi:hypothetical protein